MTHRTKRFFPFGGAVLVILGAIWFLQGINVLLGSFMTGQTKWALIGGSCFVAGAVLLALSKWF